MKGSSINDVILEGEGKGGAKIGHLGWFSRHNSGIKGREGVKKMEVWDDVIYG